ncbi:MAG: hypothetical protein HKN61_09525 [Flavobacteriaceae bacterium]|nr:hypothetical protein [Flavobacteriaceae bacterium]
MLKTIQFLFIVLCISLSGCKEQDKSEEKGQRMQKVMEIHDEAMPRMGELSKLVGEMKARVDSTERGQEYEEAMEELQEAYSGMMEWMQNFGDRFEPDEIINGKELSEEKQEWLLEEEENIKEVREQINSSINRARELLEKDSIE